MKKILVLYLIILPFNLLSQFGPNIKYHQQIVKSKKIKSISEWLMITDSSMTKVDSILKHFHLYDNKGNRLLYRQMNYANKFSNERRYEYDSLNNLLNKYEVDKDSFISFFYEYIYQDTLLLEKRKYNIPFKEFKISNRRLVKNESYYFDIYSYNKDNKLIESRFCYKDYGIDSDSIAEVYDSSLDVYIYKLVKRKHINRDSIRCIRTTKFNYDINGNLLVKCTISESSIIRDSFIYDKNNNPIYYSHSIFDKIQHPNNYSKQKFKHNYILFQNLYQNKKLIESKLYYNGDNLAYIKKQYYYYNNGKTHRILTKVYYPFGYESKVTFSDYSKNITGIQLWQIHTIDQDVDSTLSDTILLEEYDKFGFQTNLQKHYGLGQIDKEGTLFYKKEIPTNQEGIPIREYTYYAKMENGMGKGDISPQFKYFWNYNYNSLGLIKETIKSNGQTAYKIHYEYH